MQPQCCLHIVNLITYILVTISRLRTSQRKACASVLLPRFTMWNCDRWAQAKILSLRQFTQPSFIHLSISDAACSKHTEDLDSQLLNFKGTTRDSGKEYLGFFFFFVCSYFGVNHLRLLSMETNWTPQGIALMWSEPHFNGRTADYKNNQVQ